jgi:replicative DNA helicase
MSELSVDSLDVFPVADSVGGNVALDKVAPGGAWILDKGSEATPVWGEGDRILWSAGEPCYLVGPQGVGKSTVAQQLVLARVGVRPSSLLGLNIASDTRRVLYFASDRPTQVARSLRRMVSETDRQVLDDRLRVFSGPPTFSITADPTSLLQVAKAVDAGTVIVDSAKDLAVDLETGPTGAAVNQAMQHLVSNGIEVLVLHHQRKAQEKNRRPKSLADVYGSTWITSGAGSVLLLWGEAGDPVVELLHLKIPVEPVGPLRLLHDHTTGTTTLAEPPPDPLAVLRRARDGMTAKDLAAHLAAGEDVRRADVQRARRQLDRLVAEQLAHKRAGDKTRQIPDTYVAAAFA